MINPRQQQWYHVTLQSMNTMGVVAVVLGVVALLTAWIPQKQFVVSAFAVSAFVLGTIGTYRSFKRRTGPPVVSQLGTMLGLVTMMATTAGSGGPADEGPTSAADGDENYRMESRTPPGLPTAEPSAPTEPSESVPREITEGTWVVGEDIAPGTYRTGGPAGGEFGFCTWERSEDPSTEGPPIITGNMVAEPATITIDPGDGAFETDGCRPWVKVRG